MREITRVCHRKVNLQRTGLLAIPLSSPNTAPRPPFLSRRANPRRRTPPRGGSRHAALALLCPHQHELGREVEVCTLPSPSSVRPEPRQDRRHRCGAGARGAVAGRIRTAGLRARASRATGDGTGRRRGLPAQSSSPIQMGSADANFLPCWVESPW